MSLLMEALRKAEEAKRNSLEQEPMPAAPASTLPRADIAQTRDPRSGFSLEPREPSPPPPLPFADPEPAAPDATGTTEATAAPRDEVQDYLAADPVVPEDTQHPPRRSARRNQTRDQLAAASVFAAKQPAPGKPAQEQRIAVLLGLLAFVCVTVGGGLWYLQQRPVAGIGIDPALANVDISNRGFLGDTVAAAAAQPTVEAPATAVDTPIATTAPEPAPAANSDTAATTAEQSAQAVAATGPDATGADAIEPDITEPGITAPEITAIAATATTNTTAAPTELPAAPPAMAASPSAQSEESTAPASPTTPTPTAATATTSASPRTLEITRSSGRGSSVNGTLQSAWNALQAGELQTAALLYGEVLGGQANNRDALLGMAAIHLRNGAVALARQHYEQLLTLNPQDAYAQAGLLQTMQSTNDPGYEAELRNLLQRHPQLPPLHFALGNLLAAQQRWSEAQAAYFDALLHASRDPAIPASPDYAFNLAVSLERLQQPEAALNYYRQALELSRSSQPRFDPALLQSRLAFLQEQTQP